jgi:phospholipid transport system substrate-binding protein
LKRPILAALAAAVGLSLTGAAHAAPADPAATQVERLCTGVIEAVKQAKGADLQARARRIQPVIEAGFEIPVMAQFAVGPSWETKVPPADRAALVAALTRHTAARYAQEFDSYSGQRCVIDPTVQTRGPDKLVKSQIIEAHDTSSVNYRLREYGGTWKVIDVYYEGVSQLATERADFAGVLQTGGASALVAKLNELTAKMR